MGVCDGGMCVLLNVALIFNTLFCDVISVILLGVGRKKFGGVGG